MVLLLLLVSLVMAAEPVVASSCPSAAKAEAPLDYLVTTSPGSPLFSVFGHSALWLSGGGLSRPVVLDWGNFDSTVSDPAADFLSGQMMYTLEALTPEELLDRAQQRDRTAIAQRLALPPDEAMALRGFVMKAMAGERAFLYDPVRDNCSTRIRDALDHATGGAVSAQLVARGGRTARQETLRHMGAPQRGLLGGPLWFGWHLLWNGAADRVLTDAESVFMPDNLMVGLRSVQLTWPDGQTHALVPEECVLHDGAWEMVPEDPPSRGLPLGLLGVGLAAVVATGRRVGGGALAGVGVLAGGFGLLSAAIVATSVMEGLGANHAWWLVGPGSLLLVPAGIALWRGRVARWHLVTVGALLVAGLIGSVLSAAGLVTQVLWPTPALMLPPLVAAVVTLARVRLAPANRAG